MPTTFYVVRRSLTSGSLRQRTKSPWQLTSDFCPRLRLRRSMLAWPERAEWGSAVFAFSSGLPLAFSTAQLLDFSVSVFRFSAFSSNHSPLTNHDSLQAAALFAKGRSGRGDWPLIAAV